MFNLKEKEGREGFKKLLQEVPLTAREKMVITYRNGLDDGITHTLEETGRLFGVTRERIRQMEAKILAQMALFAGHKSGDSEVLDKELTRE